MLNSVKYVLHILDQGANMKRLGEKYDGGGSTFCFAVRNGPLQQTGHSSAQQDDDVANGTQTATRHLTVTGMLLM
jgi:hypothetical protein